MTQLSKANKLCAELGMDPFDLKRGPWPVGDNVGFKLAIVILRASQQPGRNSAEYVQFDSVRKIRAGVSTVYETSAVGTKGSMSFRGEKGRALRLSSSETESMVFGKFMRGLELRMGRLVLSNVGLDHRILAHIIDAYDKDLMDKKLSWERKRKIIMTGGYFMTCFGASLRGNEGFYLERSSLVDMIEIGKSEKEVELGIAHVCAPLLGRFKAESGEDKHVAVICNVSKSGLEFRLWLERVAAVLKMEQKHLGAGPAFCHTDGTMMRSYEMDEELYIGLRKVQQERPDLLPTEVEVEKVYGTFRSLRQGSHTRATEEGIRGVDLELVNRWRMFESGKGGRPHMSMRQHYLEIKLVLKRTLTYSKVL